MQIDTSFEVPVPVDQAWDVLLDVEEIAPCMPGASLEGRDGDAYKGKVKLKVGPIQAQYAGTAEITEADRDAGRLTLAARGREQRGMGTADATVVATLHEVDGGAVTRVDVATTLNITGKAAQFGRGVMQDVARKLVGQFAINLAGHLAARQETGAAEGPGAAGPATEPGTATEPAGEQRDSASPEGAPPGTASPEPASPGSASPGSASPGSASPGSASSGSASSGSASSGSASSGAASTGDAASAAGPTPAATPRPAPAAAPESSINVLSLLASSPRVWGGLVVLILIVVILAILIF